MATAHAQHYERMMARMTQHFYKLSDDYTADLKKYHQNTDHFPIDLLWEYVNRYSDMREEMSQIPERYFGHGYNPKTNELWYRENSTDFNARLSRQLTRIQQSIRDKYA